MIGRKADENRDGGEKPKGFDDYALRLGDVMRGERATMGKSLLDVQRELRIKASYIAAIENCDPDAFDTPGFIAGYVRSYARYLNMEPDACFEAFCAESGFSVAHGMSSQASVIKKPNREERVSRRLNTDVLANSRSPFAGMPSGDGFLSRVEPGAIGSSAVLLALIGLIGFGGYSVLREVQRVQVAPIEQPPVVLSELDPLDSATAREADFTSPTAPGGFAAPRAEALDRLYRPQALDVPVLVARDAPIATLDPRQLGNFAVGGEREDVIEKVAPVDERLASVAPAVPQVVEKPGPRLRLVAVRPSWVRIKSADGTVIFEKTMDPGESWDAPLTEEPPTLLTGESGAIYFAMGNDFYGPVGPRGAVTSDVAMDVATLKERFQPADLEAENADQELVRYAQVQQAIDAVED